MDNQQHSNTRPEWFSAIASGDIMKIKMMVAKKTIDLKTKYKEDMMAAFSFGDASKGANIFTPLGFAVYHDQNHIIELLLQGGADKTDTFEVGGVTYAPLDYAEQKGKKKALKTLQTYKIKEPRAGSAAAAAAAAAPAASAEPAKTASAEAPAAAVARSAPIKGERTMLMFPGQGAQKIGMGKGLESIPRVKEMISKAKEIMGYDLWSVSLNGPESKLNSTLVSQPALYLVSLAALEKNKIDEPAREKNCVVTAGLSLGEYTALCYAGVVSFEDGLRLVKARAEAMQKAADANPSGMVSVLGLTMTADKVRELCEEAAKNTKESIVVSNALCMGNTAVSGSLKACDEVMRLGERFGATKTVKLAVAGAFHSEFMRSAYDDLKTVLDTIEFRAPTIPVVFNVDGTEETDPQKMKEKLLEQLIKPVLWEKSIVYALDKFELAHTVEVGPNNVLTGIMRRILKEYKGANKPNPKATNA